MVSRSSSFVFKDQAVPVAEAAGKLGVRYIVEGSIRKAGNRVRITAQLIDGHSDAHIWAERYDRDMEDIFEVQDDVVRRVASTLVGRLEHERQERAKRKSKYELRAYDLYLRAREHFFAWSAKENRKAVELLDSAIAIEPGYAAALALLSEARYRDWMNGWSENPESDLADAFSLAAGAVEFDEDDSRTHTALAVVCLFVTVRRPGDWGPAKLWRRLSACWHARTHSIGRMRSYRLRVRCQSFRRGRSQMSFLGWVRLVCLS